MNLHPETSYPAALGTERPAANWGPRFAASALLMMLVACGGGGGGSAPPPPPPPPASIDLGGTLTAADVSVVDGDTADLFQSNYRINDSPLLAQELTTPVTVVGAVNRVGFGLGRHTGLDDTEDWFYVNLKAGQVVELLVGLSAGSSNDADLCVISADAESGSCSVGVGDRECVRATADGDYYIIVDEFTSASVYNLRVSAPGSGGDCDNEVSPLSAAVPGQWLALDAADSSPASGREGRQALAAGRQVMLANLQQRGLDRERHEALGLDRLELPRNRAALDALLGQLDGGARAATRARLAAVPQANRPRALAAAPERHERVQAFRLEHTLAKRLQRAGGYAAVERNWILRNQAQLVGTLPPPDERYLAQRWHYEQIGLPAAMDLLVGLSPQPTRRPLVAVIDDGVMLDHPDIAPQLIGPGRAFASNTTVGDDDRANGEPLATRSEDSFHGLHVAGTAAAATFDSGAGSFGAGVAPMAQLLPVRVFGAGGGATSLDVAEGIRYASALSNRSGAVPARRADVINLSLGAGIACPTVFRNAVNAARAAGVVVVAAAGNDARNDQGRAVAVSAPPNCEGVIAVAALDALRRQTRYSNSGPEISLAAPGGDGAQRSNGSGTPDSVYSAWGVFDAAGQRRAGFIGIDGTSMASPHVAGVVALMRWANPALAPADIDALLAQGALSDDLGLAGRDNSFGHGVVNALKAVEAALGARSGSPPAAQPTPLVARPSTLDFGSSSTALTLRVAPSGTAGSDEAVLGMVSDSTAISAEPLVVDAQGRGDWRVRVDRSRVPATTASYFPRLTVQLSPSRSVQVQLAFTVVAADAASRGGDVGPVYVLVLDPDSNQLREVRASFADGRYSWRMNGYTGTRAVIVAGTDLDADDLLCQPAEVCGGFPVLGTVESMTVPISRTRLDLDFGLLPRTDASVARLGRPAPVTTP